jgi:hypothetical protein
VHRATNPIVPRHCEAKAYRTYHHHVNATGHHDTRLRLLLRTQVRFYVFLEARSSSPMAYGGLGSLSSSDFAPWSEIGLRRGSKQTPIRCVVIVSHAG